MPELRNPWRIEMAELRNIVTCNVTDHELEQITALAISRGQSIPETIRELIIQGAKAQAINHYEELARQCRCDGGCHG
jgi:predicted component of type VI protein secretion system